MDNDTYSVRRKVTIVNFDEQFRSNVDRLGTKVVVLNHLNLTDPNFEETISDHIFSSGAPDDAIARCGCHNLVGNKHIGATCGVCGQKVTLARSEPTCDCGLTKGMDVLGDECPECHSHVTFGGILDSNSMVARNWLSAPRDLPNGWLNPQIYLVLSTWMQHKNRKGNYLDDILNVNEPISDELSTVITDKGFAYFHKEFDRLIDFFAHSHPVVSAKPDTPLVLAFIELYRDRIWCHYIPLLNSALAPAYRDDRPGRRKMSDQNTDMAMSAAITLADLEHRPPHRDRAQQLHRVERLTWDAYSQIIAYAKDGKRKYMSHKRALPRMMMFGARVHHSARAVITPITEPHSALDIHFPYPMAVNTYRVPILNKLVFKRGYTPRQAYRKVKTGVMAFDDEIYEILMELIDESEFRGLPFLWHRAPSIREGNVMLKFITKIKKDINQQTVSVSPVDGKLPNLDFDGDTQAGFPIFESEMVHAFYYLTTNALIYDANTGKVSSEIGLNPTLCVNINKLIGAL
jgi:hypothetical protein